MYLKYLNMTVAPLIFFCIKSYHVKQMFELTLNTNYKEAIMNHQRIYFGSLDSMSIQNNPLKLHFCLVNVF